MKQLNRRGGKREGAGRKPSPVPLFLKKFRATEEERKEFMSYMTGDARFDFEQTLGALRYRRNILKRKG